MASMLVKQEPVDKGDNMLYVVKKNTQTVQVDYLINRKTLYSWFMGVDGQTYRCSTFQYDRITRMGCDYICEV